MRRISKGLLSLSLLMGLGACGTSEDNSSQLITNGKNASATEFPSVITLYDAKVGAICTGTFVNDSTVLTAAHCTMGSKVDASGKVNGSMQIINIIDASKGEAALIAESVAVYRNPLWDKNGGNVNKYDLGIIVFPKGTGKAISQIAPVAAKGGDRLTIVGYGLNQTTRPSDASSVGVKRIGLNTVASVSGGFIKFKGVSKTTVTDGSVADSSASVGDSGGPLFINGKVAGVTSGGGGGLGALFGGKTDNLYINLHSPESKAFLSKYLEL